MHQVEAVTQEYRVQGQGSCQRCRHAGSSSHTVWRSGMTVSPRREEMDGWWAQTVSSAVISVSGEYIRSGVSAVVDSVQVPVVPYSKARGTSRCRGTAATAAYRLVLDRAARGARPLSSPGRPCRGTWSPRPPGTVGRRARPRSSPHAGRDARPAAGVSLTRR